MNCINKPRSIVAMIMTALLPLCSPAQTPITLFPSQSASDFHRIPSLVRLKNGTLAAYSDLRIHGSGDTGANAIAVVARTSTDDGATWTDAAIAIEGGGVNFDYAHGDAATVVDRESGKVLMMTASGTIGWGSSSKSNKLQVGRSLSTDDGKSWQTKDWTEKLYQGDIEKLFFSSGRIIQSTVCKAGDYYRIYAGVDTRPGGSRVVYSDDLGETWNYLGGVAATPVPDGDECKVEELPSGDILFSCRRVSGTGRDFNVFIFTDRDKAEGAWAEVATSGSTQVPGQTYAATCNGEVLLVPALRLSDHQPTYVLLQSAAASANREHVSIYYKELPESYTSPNSFVDGWGKYQISTTTSCYSTMVLDRKGNIAFLYEENANGGYDIVFNTLSLSTITGNAYAYRASDKGKYHTTSEPSAK